MRPTESLNESINECNSKKTFQDTLLYITNVLWALFFACIKIAAFFI